MADQIKNKLVLKCYLIHAFGFIVFSSLFVFVFTLFIVAGVAVTVSVSVTSLEKCTC